jgi:hypothetical protein
VKRDALLTAEVEALCNSLRAEPLFHASLGSKELFHSNLLAWFADSFPRDAAAVFRAWGTALPRAAAMPSERESTHLDLVLHLPGLAPLAIENKVFSVPNDEQLSRYDEGAISRRGLAGHLPSKVLLSLISPGWTEYQGWRWVSYRKLASALDRRVSQVKIADEFAGDVLDHYVRLIRLLVQLVDLLGTPTPEAPFLLPPAITAHLDRARLSAAVQKARASLVVRELQRAIAAQGGVAAEIDHGFTRGTVLLEGFHRLAPKENDPSSDFLGWQLQGSQFRLAVITGRLGGRSDRERREAYVMERYPHWFDFSLVEKVAGIAPTSHSRGVRGGRWKFHGYSPDFVYRYCVVPDLTMAQILEVGLGYLRLAGHTVHGSGAEN